jgi:hypothetical protein
MRPWEMRASFAERTSSSPAAERRTALIAVAALAS